MMQATKASVMNEDHGDGRGGYSKRKHACDRYAPERHDGLPA
jgi:hypothetical protein